MHTRFTRIPESVMPLNFSADDGFSNIAREGWRELGFWYECNVPERRWTFRGDHAGLMAFAKAVREFLASPESEQLGEHAHLGPFSNLRLISAREPAVTWRGIAGRREDFEAFAEELEALGIDASLGRHAIGKPFGGAEDFVLCFVVEPDGFDPGSIDPDV